MKAKFLNPAILLVLITIAGAIYFSSTFISPFLHYQLQHIAFISGNEFFQDYVDYPGGIADYCSLFSSQFFTFNIPGSILLVLIASIQGFIALILVKRLTGNYKLHYVVFTSVLLFGIIVFLNYLYPYYITFRLLFAFIFTWIYSFIQGKYQKQSLYYWFIMAGLLFYLASGPALFVFSLSSAFIHLRAGKKKLIWVPVILMILFAGVLPFLGFKFIFQTSLENLYKISIMKPPAMLSYTPEFSVYVYYSLLPFILLIVWLAVFIPEKKVISKTGKKSVSKYRFLRYEIIYMSLQIIAISIAAYVIFKKEYNPLKKNILTIEYYAEHEQWEEVLRTTRKIHEYDFRVNFHGARAIAHLGLLPEQLFDYPQLLGTYGLFINANMAKSATIITSDLYFDLGHMSESQHWAFEAQTLLPNSPRILKRLIMINLVNRNYILAEKFLNILDKNMLFHDWVQKYNKYIADTTLAGKDQLIAEKRHFSPNKTAINTRDEDCLRLLVATCPENRMAYDYLLSYFLLDANLINFVDYLKLHKNYNIKTLPRAWEEGLILFVAKTRVIPVDFSPEIISEKTIKKFTEFTSIINQNNNNLTAARNILNAKYGNTYWFYNLYFDPKVTNVLSNKTEVK